VVVALTHPERLAIVGTYGKAAWRGFKARGKTFLSHFERTALLNGTVEAIGEENTGGIQISDLNVGVRNLNASLSPKI
jgi:hypothetical protein